MGRCATVSSDGSACFSIRAPSSERVSTPSRRTCSPHMQAWLGLGLGVRARVRVRVRVRVGVRVRVQLTLTLTLTPTPTPTLTLTLTLTLNLCSRRGRRREGTCCRLGGGCVGVAPGGWPVLGGLGLGLGIGLRLRLRLRLGLGSGLAYPSRLMHSFGELCAILPGILNSMLYYCFWLPKSISRSLEYRCIRATVSYIR